MEVEPGKRAADVLARRLYAAGCRHAFGMPGGEVLTLLDAFERAGISFHLAKHENAGGFMAEGTWHMSGAPAILLATIGPGVTNAVNVVANASQDRVPLIIISGAIDAVEAATYTHQVLDHRAILKPICKASFELTAGAAGAIADKAVNVAMQMRCGPVHIDVPIAVAGAPAEDYPWQRARLERVRPVAGEALEAARGWVAGAERPLLIIGHDAILDGSSEQLREVAAATHIPVMTTYKAKGVIPEDAKNVVAGFSLSPLADSHLLPLVGQADVVVLAGFDPIEVRTGWRNPFNLDRQKVIEIAGEVNDHYVHQSSVSFICHTGEGVKALFAGIERSLAWSRCTPVEVRTALSTAYGQSDDWGPAAIVDEVRNTLPSDAVLTIDTGAHRIVASQVWQSSAPSCLLQSVGLGSMGCGLPLAIGAKLAAPDRVAVVMTGDGGLMMALGELSTLSDLELAIPVVVFVDRSLALIEKKQRERQLPNAGVDFPGDYDYVQLAQAFGGSGCEVNSRHELAGALTKALAAPTFSLLACVIDRQAYDGRL